MSSSLYEENLARDATRRGGGARAVFLDRDGVINNVILRDGKPHPPPSLEALRILPGVAETIAAFRDSHLRVIVVTNQPDVATGVQRREVVDEMHHWLEERLAIDAIKTCFHVDADACSCRKPRPGLLLEAAQEWGLKLDASYLVGDRWRDIGAGNAVGCRTLWIDRGYHERAPEKPGYVVSSLAEAGHMILSELASRSARGTETPHGHSPNPETGWRLPEKPSWESRT